MIATCRPRRAFASDHPRATDCAVGRVCGGRNFLSVATGKVEEGHVRLVPLSRCFMLAKGWKIFQKGLARDDGKRVECME